MTRFPVSHRQERWGGEEQVVISFGRSGLLGQGCSGKKLSYTGRRERKRGSRASIKRTGCDRLLPRFRYRLLVPPDLQVGQNEASPCVTRCNARNRANSQRTDHRALMNHDVIHPIQNCLPHCSRKRIYCRSERCHSGIINDEMLGIHRTRATYRGGSSMSW